MPRPEVVAVYYSGSNAVDSHNHVRQFELALEQHWITNDGFFRMAATMLGMTITDSWLAVRYGVGGNSPFKNMPIREFADRLARELLKRRWSTDPNPPIYLVDLPRPPRPSDASAVSDLSETAAGSSAMSLALAPRGAIVVIPQGDAIPVIPECYRDRHHQELGPRLAGSTRTPRKDCANRDCKSKSTYICVQCNKHYCDDKHVGHCFYAHICRAYIDSGDASDNWKKGLKDWEAQCTVALLLRKKDT